MCNLTLVTVNIFTWGTTTPVFSHNVLFTGVTNGEQGEQLSRAQQAQNSLTKTFYD